MAGAMNNARGGFLVEAPLMTEDDPFWVYCQEEVRLLVREHAQKHRWSAAEALNMLQALGLGL